MAKELIFNFQSFNEISFGLKDISYFYNIDIDKEKLLYNISVEVRLLESKLIELVLHTKYVYATGDDEKSMKTIFHGDFTSLFNIKEIENYLYRENKLVAIEKEVLKMLLGVCVSTTRGYLLARTKGSIIGNYPLPIIYPDKFIDERCDFLKESYVIIDELD